MKSKIITLLLLAAFCTASAASCGTVENVSDSSAIIKIDESSAADESLEDVTSGTQTSAVTTTSTAVTTSATTAVSEPATEKVVSAGNGYVADPGTAPEPVDTPDEEPVYTPEPQTEPPTDPPTEAPAGSFSHEDMFFVYGGAQATVLVDAAGLVSALGTPSSVEQAPSCLTNGCDVKNYYYSGLTVYTYIDGDREVIYEIEMTSPSYTTTKGLAPGMSVADAESLYGTNYTSGGGVISYYDSDSTYMYLIVSGDTITSIGYAAEV